MPVIKCKMCGGDMELSADKSMGTCQYCGSTMTLPKVNDEQRAAAFDRGNHFRRIGEFDKALSVYERIVQEDDSDAEAHWCCALCRFGIEWVKDPASGEYLPTCHRASFDSFLEDVDYQAALAHADAVAKAHYQSEGEKIAAVQRGILSISQKEQPFDVFLCYKETDDKGQRTVDSTLAQEIYYQLTEQGRRVFFARITLEDKAGQEYEPYIFAALHSAKVMVVVGTKPEYLNAVWVKNEWSRYLGLMKNDRKRLLIPCFRDMDPYDLPEQLSVLQSYDMSKIGFIQDLTRGIAKVLGGDKKPEVKETVVVQGEGGSNLSALLKRGYMALEDGEWQKADEFFEQVLNLDAECAEAYWGKVLAENQCSNADEFKDLRLKTTPLEHELYPCIDELIELTEAAIKKYTVPGYLEPDDIKSHFGFTPSVQTTAMSWNHILTAEETYWQEDKLLVRAQRFAKGEFAQSLNGLRESILEQMRKELTTAEEKKKVDTEAVMAAFSTEMEKAEKAVEQLYESALVYKDVDEQNQAKAEAEAEAQRKAAAEKTAKRAKRNKKIAIAAAALLILGAAGYLLTTRVIIPAGQYKEAEAMLDAEEYDAAIEVFTTLGNYSDAQDRVKETTYAKAEAMLAVGGHGYDVAIETFTALGDYSDAQDRVKEASYAKGEAILALGGYDTAIEIFMDLGDYSDAKVRLLDAKYLQARHYEEEGDYLNAMRCYAGVIEYKDSRERRADIRDTSYKLGTEEMANGNYAAASEYFSASGDGYLDSSTLRHYCNVMSIDFQDGELHDLSNVIQEIGLVRDLSLKEELSNISVIKVIYLLEGTWEEDVGAPYTFRSGIASRYNSYAGKTYNDPIVYYNGTYWIGRDTKEERFAWEICNITDNTFDIRHYENETLDRYLSTDTYRKKK